LVLVFLRKNSMLESNEFLKKEEKKREEQISKFESPKVITRWASAL